VNSESRIATGIPQQFCMMIFYEQYVRQQSPCEYESIGIEKELKMIVSDALPIIAHLSVVVKAATR
jgi:hypothetical protein